MPDPPVVPVVGRPPPECLSEGWGRFLMRDGALVAKCADRRHRGQEDVTASGAELREAPGEQYAPNIRAMGA